ncbi:IS66 family insertion sequence element accessory protein TnpB [[Clostridium] hylemonae]|uniref:IS66 family insertion sequence element accessory protein TnpB n=1 Tax=[Clostridium] hylemonae TaxID=89153 RepID=UPI003A7F4994
MSLPIFVCGILRAERFYLTWGYTDMGRVINGLAAIVQYNFKLDFFSNNLSLFCGRKYNRIKAFDWKGNRFLL